MSNRHAGIVLLLATLTATLLVAATSLARPQTTIPQTIADRDGDNRLEPAPGEEHVVRDELGPPRPFRRSARR